jgi:hypothetical protein
VCEQIVDPKEVHAGSLPLLVLRLREERLVLCPSCTQAVPPDLQRDPQYRRRWDRFVRQMISAMKRGVKWHEFKPRSEPSQ